MTKDEARKILKNLRSKVGDRISLDRRIASIALEVAASYESVFIYVSMGSEVSTRDIIPRLCESKTVFVPHTDSDKTMHAVRVELPLREPDAIGNTQSNPNVFFDGQAGIIFVPLLGFDSECRRLGYGAGCYDKYFEKYPCGLKVGLAYSEQLSEFETDAFDVPLDMIITPDGIIRRQK